MERCFLFGPFNTWTDWGLILTQKGDIDPPEVRTNYTEIEGMSGSLDLSEALAGEPTFKDRAITASFCACEGSYRERRVLMGTILSQIHGRKLRIVEPDDPGHYFMGRVKVKNIRHTVPLTEFSVECICEPWRYENMETVQTFPVSGEIPAEIRINNEGRKTVCPEITVTGQVTFTCCGVTSSATDGTYRVTTFKLYQGENIIRVSGNGTLTLRYRKADL